MSAPVYIQAHGGRLRWHVTRSDSAWCTYRWEHLPKLLDGVSAGYRRQFAAFSVMCALQECCRHYAIQINAHPNVSLLDDIQVEFIAETLSQGATIMVISKWGNLIWPDLNRDYQITTATIQQLRPYEGGAGLLQAFMFTSDVIIGPWLGAFGDIVNRASTLGTTKTVIPEQIEDEIVYPLTQATLAGNSNQNELVQALLARPDIKKMVMAWTRSIMEAEERWS